MEIFTKVNSLIKIDKFNKNLVPKFIYYEKNFFIRNKEKCINMILEKFKKNIIIRSSALNEDSKTQSKAGFYDSFHIKNLKFDEIEDKILKIISKFKNDKDQILIQQFIIKPDIAGVIFTKDKSTDSHYFDINYDTSKKSNLVTSGIFNPTIKSLIIFKNSDLIPKKFFKLLKISSQLENIFNNDRLDIEFCIKNKKTYILQCRPLLGVTKKIDIRKLDSVILNLRKKFDKINIKNQTLFGNKTFLSNMSDWNPAEMIGKKPTQLSTSLYSELITDQVWSEQRKNYGYKDVFPNKLMVNFAGTPYIDLRVDLNSFLPSDLSSKISNKLINYFINKIKKYPELHDKIEFELINTCYDFSLYDRKDLPLTKKEKKDYFLSLKKITNNILDPSNKFLSNEIDKINLLERKIKLISNSNLSPIQKIYYLTNDCKKYGTLPFAGIARCAFISKSILDSLKKKKLIDDTDIEKFYLQINTISKKINYEYLKSKQSNSFKVFFQKYGHLRPSTYSISTKNYKENHKNYFSRNFDKSNFLAKKKFDFTKSQTIKIDKIFKKHNLVINFNQFLNFTKLSVENREYAKLIFSKSINEIFVNLKKIAVKMNIDIKKFEHLNIELILKSFNNLEQEKLKKSILKNISSNEKSYKFSQSLITSDVISDSKNFKYFYNLHCKENFITKKTTTGDIININKLNNLKEISKKIILIENADPGYDFLFSYKIKGLITKYGGSNSHMAIRCMELGLPAIIGVGEKIYEQFSKSKKIFIDCNNKNYSIIY